MEIVLINMRIIMSMNTDRRFNIVVDYALLTPQIISVTILQMNVRANTSTVKDIHSFMFIV